MPFTDSNALVLSAGRGRAAIKRRYVEPLDFTGKDLSIGVQLHRGDSGTFKVDLRAPDANNSVTYKRYINGSDWLRLDLGPSNVVGSPDLSEVYEIRLSFRAADRPFSLRLDALRTTPKASRGTVLLTFDDGSKSVYDTALPILRKLGLRASLGVIPWTVGQDDTHLNEAQIRELSDAGWEIVSHPQFHNQPLPALSSQQRRQAIRHTKAWLLQRGFESGAQTLIYPFGKYDGTLDLVGQYHRLAFAGGNTPFGTRLTEPACIPRVNGDDVGRTRRAINYATKYNQTLTIMLHTVGESSDRIGRDEFARLMGYLSQQNVDVTTPSALLEKPVYQP